MKEEKEDVVYSIVAPVYNEKDVLPEFCARVTAVMKAMGKPYEIILVNDGSKDGSLEVLKDLSKKDGRIKAISFSRNFGHQIALTAGMDCSGGRAVILGFRSAASPGACAKNGRAMGGGVRGGFYRQGR